MRWMMRRARRNQRDRGAVAVLTAILLSFFLVGISAVVVDTGSWYAERAQLQNGSDAAALAVAKTCASVSTGCPSNNDLATKYSDDNANDDVANLDVVCGSPGVTHLAPCTPAQRDGHYCPVAPSVGKYVNVHNSTLTDKNSHLLPPLAGRVLLGNSYDGENIKSCAQASWGPPKISAPILALTVAQCVWNDATSGGNNYAPSPPAVPPASYEHALVVHNPDDPTDPSCHSSNGIGPLPGGFGWTQTNNDQNCTTDFTAVGGGWYISDPGQGTNTGTGCGHNNGSDGVIPCAQNPVVPAPFPPNSLNTCPSPPTPSPLIVPIYDQVCVQPGGTTAANEVDVVTVTNATGGTYTLTVNNGVTPVTTAAIAFNATASTVQTRLTTALGSGTATVTGNTGGPYTITFAGTYGNRDITLTATSSLTPPNGRNAASIAITTQTNGVSSTTSCPSGFANGKYFHLSTLAAFVVTGYEIPGGLGTKSSWLTQRNYCVNQHGTDPTCVMGYFVKAVITGGEIGDGGDTGVTVVRLTG